MITYLLNWGQPVYKAWWAEGSWVWRWATACNLTNATVSPSAPEVHRNSTQAVCCCPSPLLSVPRAALILALLCFSHPGCCSLPLATDYHCHWLLPTQNSVATEDRGCRRENKGWGGSRRCCRKAVQVRLIQGRIGVVCATVGKRNLGVPPLGWC